MIHLTVFVFVLMQPYRFLMHNYRVWHLIVMLFQWDLDECRLRKCVFMNETLFPQSIIDCRSQLCNCCTSTCFLYKSRRVPLRTLFTLSLLIWGGVSVFTLAQTVESILPQALLIHTHTHMTAVLCVDSFGDLARLIQRCDTNPHVFVHRCFALSGLQDIRWFKIMFYRKRDWDWGGEKAMDLKGFWVKCKSGAWGRWRKQGKERRECEKSCIHRVICKKVTVLNWYMSLIVCAYVCVAIVTSVKECIYTKSHTNTL